MVAWGLQGDLMLVSAYNFLFGSPLPTHEEMYHRLTKVKALAVFSSDALSSVAYAPEEILLVLVLGGSAALQLSVPIALVIAVRDLMESLCGNDLTSLPST